MWTNHFAALYHSVDDRFLNPLPDDTILEAGTGQAAVMAILVKQVYSVEIVEQLATQSSARLQKLGYTTVAVKTGGGYCGWPEHAPATVSS